ncbi:MAG: FRG domain-containing protein [Verrucomicrobia bacterium]|nr:FRG domain-containing protein [Verrucomicrobiota bacterium]
MENDTFETIQISDWSEVFNLPEVKHGSSVFRGHSSADWKLRTSLDREFERCAISSEYYLHKERALLIEFRRRAHLYTHDLPEPDSIVSWLALMQHHGAPTRLLDFSYSFFIACYLAFSAGSGNSAVWAVSDLWLRTCVTDADLREDALGAQIDFANKQLRSFHDDFKGGGKPNADSSNNLVLMIEPTRQIQRLAVQQGVFLMPLNLHVSFIENLRACSSYCDEPDSDWLKNTKEHVKKIVFTDEVRRVGLRELRKMNITAESLFPGMDGFAKSLSHTVLVG